MDQIYGSLVFITIGLMISFLPTKVLLSFDRASGYHIYKQVLSETGDEEKAIKAAGKFYRYFGLVPIALGTFVLITTLMKMF